MTQASFLPAISSFISMTEMAKIPPAAIDRARLVILDSVGAIIGGMAEPEMRRLVVAPWSAGQSPILGTDALTDSQTAAFLNGMAGTVLEMDEGNQFARGHPGMHVFPALLAAVADHPCSGPEFLRAFIIGYDVAARAGIGTKLRMSMHPHGTWGTVGAAAALAALHRMTRDETQQLLNIASSLTLATSRRTMLEGGTVRNAYTGISNQMAHLTLRLWRSGISGERDGISSVFGEVVSTGFDHESACEHLGDRFEITRNYFKLHACCRYNHAALDALVQLMSQHDQLANLDGIERIDVKSYSLAAELDDQAPRNMLAAKFSVPFAVATTLVTGRTGVESFSGDALTDPRTLALARRVTVSEDESMTAKLPDLRPASVAIHMTDGTRLHAAVETNRGDWQDPYSADQIFEKYMSLTRRLWHDARCRQLADQIQNIEQETDLTKVFSGAISQT
ncbi:MAG: MmgE/PrpD family protein [Candidatus Puniceispirillaceae bacterium]